MRILRQNQLQSCDRITLASAQGLERHCGAHGTAAPLPDAESRSESGKRNHGNYGEASCAWWGATCDQRSQRSALI